MDESKGSEEEFRKYFGSLDSRYVNCYPCAWQCGADIILIQGRVYITEANICFCSTEKELLKVISFSDVINITKKKTALVFSNAIEITYKRGSELFTFQQRDQVFDILFTLWQKAKAEERLGANAQSLKKNEPYLSPPTSPRDEELSQRSDGGLQNKDVNLGQELNLPNGKKRTIVKQDNTIPPEIVKEMRELEEILMQQKIEEEQQEKQKLEKKENTEEESEEFKDVPFPDFVQYSHLKIENEPCIVHNFPKISVKEFYSRFLQNPVFWEHVYVATDSTSVIVPSFAPTEEHPNVLSRVCTFVAPIKGAPMGPSETKVEQTQHISFRNEGFVILHSKRSVLLDSSTASLDIPHYNESFLVESLWNLDKTETGCRLTIRWKVTFLKSVWVKGMIERNAKGPTEEFFRVYVAEAVKQLQHIKKEAVQSISVKSSQEVLPISSSPVESKVSSVSFPLLGSDFSMESIVAILFLLLLITSGFYFWIRISSLQADIAHWEDESLEIEDRLIFLQSFVSRITSNISLQGKEWGYWRETKKELGWHMKEWQEEIDYLQKTMSTMLSNIQNALDDSSIRELGTSDQPFIFSSHRARSPSAYLIREVAENNPSQFFNWIIFLSTCTIGCLGLVFLVLPAL